MEWAVNGLLIVGLVCGESRSRVGSNLRQQADLEAKFANGLQGEIVRQSCSGASVRRPARSPPIRPETFQLPPTMPTAAGWGERRPGKRPYLP